MVVGESIQGKNVSLTASGAVRLQTGTNEETIHGGLTSIALVGLFWCFGFKKNYFAKDIGKRENTSRQCIA